MKNQQQTTLQYLKKTQELWAQSATHENMLRESNELLAKKNDIIDAAHTVHLLAGQGLNMGLTSTVSSLGEIWVSKSCISLV